MHDYMHNELLLEIIKLKALEHTIAYVVVFCQLPVFQSTLEVIVSLLLSNKNVKDSRTQTKILHDIKLT